MLPCLVAVDNREAGRADRGKVSERLNHADKSYLSRQRRRLVKDFHYHLTETELERIRYLYVEKGLASTQVARIVGKGPISPKSAYQRRFCL